MSTKKIYKWTNNDPTIKPGTYCYRDTKNSLDVVKYRSSIYFVFDNELFSDIELTQKIENIRPGDKCYFDLSTVDLKLTKSHIQHLLDIIYF